MNESGPVGSNGGVGSDRVGSERRALNPADWPDIDQYEPTVAYIMGYGRSGSTILDIILGSHSEITSAGELTYLRHWRSEGIPCSCGKALEQCPFWGRVIEVWQVQVRQAGHDPEIDVESRVESRKKILQDQDENTLQAYVDSSVALFRAIRMEGKARIVVDSSKSAGKALRRVWALDRLTTLDVRAIHLVRDGRAVLWSALRGPGTPELDYPDEPGIGLAFRTILSWTVTNLWSLWVGRRLGHRALLVRYEDLLSNPERELGRIGDLLDVDMTGVGRDLLEGERFQVGHNVGGNRVRLRQNIVLRPDVEWTSKLSKSYRFLFWLLAWPVALALGYAPFRSHPYPVHGDSSS